MFSMYTGMFLRWFYDDWKFIPRHVVGDNSTHLEPATYEKLKVVGATGTIEQNKVMD